ncbi:GON domain-containing protein [Chloroflexota bacterium]
MCILTVVLLASGCQGLEPEVEEPPPPENTLVTATQNTALDWYGPSGMRWGVGFDSIAMNICAGALDLDFDNMDNEIKQEGDRKTTFTMTIIKSQTELRNTLGISTNAALDIGVYKASAEGSYAKRQVKNAYSVYAIVAVEVLGPSYNIKDDRIKLTPAAQELYDNDYVNFQKIYGDQYLQTITTGGMYRAVIEIRTSSQAEQNEVYSKVGGGGPSVNIENKVGSTVKSFSEKYAMTITEFQRSGDATKAIPVTVENMVTHATEFPKDVAEADWRTCAAKATFQDYPLVVSGTALKQKRAMRELTRYYDKFNALLYDLQFINSHQAWYTEAVDWSVELNDGKTYTLLSLSNHIEKNVLLDILDVAEYCSENSLESASAVAEAGIAETYSIISEKLPLLDNYFPQSAKDIRDMYSALGDDDYTLFYQGKKDQPYEVWVKDLRSDDPKEYLTLPQSNYSSIPSDKTYYRGQDMRTTYDRIRINPITLTVDKFDTTYSDTVGGPINFYQWSKKPANKRTKTETWNFCYYGGTRNCNGDNDNSKSMARVDLQGTPFAVADDVYWEIGGHGASEGYAKLSQERQFVDIKAANGTSGWAKPKPELRLQYIPR